MRACRGGPRPPSLRQRGCLGLLEPPLDFHGWPLYSQLKIVMAHSKASWLHIFLEKVETYVTLIPRHTIAVRPDAEEVFFESQAAIGFDSDEVVVQRLPDRFEQKVVWGSRYPIHDTTSAWDAIQTLSRADVSESTIARMLGGNAAQQYGIELVQKVGA